MNKSMITICFAMCGAIALADTARIGAYVIDAVTQKPVPGIKVSASFSNDNGWKAWTESAPIYHDEQLTDANGFCEFKGKTNIGKCGCGVDKQGTKYYAGAGRGFQFSSKDLFGTWQPDNLVATIRLTRVEHPIPLWVKRVGCLDRIRSEAGHWNGTNMVFRYDLIKGDYLPPDGKGEMTDVVVESMITHLAVTNVYRQTKFFYDITNVISFPGEGNGVVPIFATFGDGIRLRVAHTNDYEQTIVMKCGMRKDVDGPNVFGKYYSESNPERCYCFRIRSRHDANGNLVKAYYGKIYGDFMISGTLENGSNVEFLYYLNPTSLDRNLEWDMKNNLCPNPGKLSILSP